MGAGERWSAVLGVGWGAAWLASSGAGTAHAEVRERVTTAADVRAICGGIRANAGSDGARRVFVINLPAKAFALGAYDASSAKVRIDDAKGFRAADGSFELVLHHIAGLEKKGERGFELAFPATGAEEAELRAAHLAGSLELALWFEAATPRDGSAVCADVRSTRGDGVRLAIEPLAFELTRHGERIASGESARFAALGDPGPVARPHVVVSAPMLTGANGRAPDRVKRAAKAMAPRLLDCYRQGLAAEPGLRGSLVAGVEVGGDGRVKTARAELDALGAPAMTLCVLQKVRETRFPGGAERLSIPMRFSD